MLGIAHKWIVSYLENRKLFVQHKNCRSNILNVCYGVPQGSILGLKLFIIVMNDICNVSKVFKFILFADETNLFYCDSNLNELIQRTNTELDKLHVWFAVNRLSLNVTKTNYMMFGNRKLNTSISIKMNKEALDRVKSQHV